MNVDPQPAQRDAIGQVTFTAGTLRRTATIRAVERLDTTHNQLFGAPC
jgi:hypothetical protein